ncbi:MAG: ATP-binding protein [Polyangiaceae bacterium]
MPDPAAESPAAPEAAPADEARSGFLSLGAKLGVAVVLVVTIASALVYFRVSQREREALIESKRVAAEMVADLFAASLGAALDFGDREAVEAEVGHLTENKEVSFVAVWQAGQAEPLVQRSTSEGGTGAAPSVARTSVSEDRIEVARSVRGGEGKEVGTALVRFSLARENAAFAVNRTRILWLVLGLALGTMTLLLLVTRISVVGPIDALLEAARGLERGERGSRVRIFANDEIGRLARAFEAMRRAIFDRERKLAEANANLRELFDHMRQGIVVFDVDGKITGTQSRQAESVFGVTGFEGREISDLLYPGAGSWDAERRAFEEWRKLAFDVSPDGWSELLALAPREVRLSAPASERALSLDFQPLVRDGAVFGVMLLATDVSDEVRLRREVQEQGERHARQLATLKRLVSGGGQLFVAFLSAARARLARSRTLMAGGDVRLRELDEAFQNLHTLKGEARSFELSELTQLIEGVENRLSTLREQARAKPDQTTTLDDDLPGALEAAARLLDEAEELFVAASPSGKAALEQVTVRRSDLDALARIAERQGGELGAVSQRLRARAFGEYLAPLLEQAPSWAEQSGKRLRVELDGREVRVFPGLAEVLPGVITHLVRNAIAHGIEAPKTRLENGKPDVGTVVISARADGDSRVVVEVCDDGAGIDENPVLAALADDKHALDLERSRDGSFRTRAGSPADDTLSGRGMGLSAVVRELEGAGYSLFVERRTTAGTRFVISPRPEHGGGRA